MDWPSEEPKSHSIPFDADAIAGTMAHVAAAQGDAAAVAVLAVANPRLQQTGYDNWNGGTDLLTLFLELPTQLYAQLFPRRKEIQDALLPFLAPLLEETPGYLAAGVSIIPSAAPPANWREMAKAWLNGEGTTNQGRVRSDNIASRSHDGLLFRSQPEINLYRALKALGVSFAPLPVFVRGGKDYRRIEPDFVILHAGLIVVVEVDGDTVHQESPAEAHARTMMLAHEGAHIERVRASDCETYERASQCAKHLLQAIEKIKAVR